MLVVVSLHDLRDFGGVSQSAPDVLPCLVDLTNDFVSVFDDWISVEALEEVESVTRLWRLKDLRKTDSRFR